MSQNEIPIDVRSRESGETFIRMQSLDEFTQSNFSKPELVTSLETFLNSKYGHPYLRFLEVEQKKECLTIVASKQTYSKKEVKDLLLDLECRIKESLEDEPNNVKAGIAFDMETEASVENGPEDLLCIQIVIGDVDDNDPLYTGSNPIPRKQFIPGDRWVSRYLQGMCDLSQSGKDGATIVGDYASFNFHVENPISDFYFDEITQKSLNTIPELTTENYGWGDVNVNDVNTCDLIMNYRGWGLTCCSSQANCTDCVDVQSADTRCRYYIFNPETQLYEYDVLEFYDVHCLEYDELNYYLTEGEIVFNAAAIDHNRFPISITDAFGDCVFGVDAEYCSWFATLIMGVKRKVNGPVIMEGFSSFTTPQCK